MYLSILISWANVMQVHWLTNPCCDFQNHIETVSSVNWWLLRLASLGEGQMMRVTAAVELSRGTSHCHVCTDRRHSAVMAAMLAQAQETLKDQRRALAVIMLRWCYVLHVHNYTAFLLDIARCVRRCCDLLMQLHNISAILNVNHSMLLWSYVMINWLLHLLCIWEILVSKSGP
jgi:hypothetical protein